MTLHDDIWWTRKARIQTEKRLLSYVFHSEALLLWYSFFGVAVSIYFLKFDNVAASNNLAGISWLVYSVLVLVIAGFIKGLSFKERARLVKECYELLKDLYHRTEKETQNSNSLIKEYKQVLSVCENHTENDFYNALCETFLTHTKEGRKQLSLLPTRYNWFRVVWAKFKWLLMLFVFYQLPIALFFLLGRCV